MGVWRGNEDFTMTNLLTGTIRGEEPSTQGVWWGHNDRQFRSGYPSTYEGFEAAMADSIGGHTGPIGSFLRGYSGSSFPSTFQASSVSDAPSLGVGAVLNVKCDFSALANGSMDGTITSFLNSWPAGTFGSLTVNHEPENDGPAPANPSNSAYVDWAEVQGPLWCEGIARFVQVAAPIIRSRGLDVKVGACLMGFSWDSTRYQFWDWWNYVDPQYFDVVEFQLDAYSKTVAGPPPYGHDLIPRILQALAPAQAVGIETWSLLETACDRRQRNNGDVLVGTDESVAAWWEDFAPRIEQIPGARLMTYFSIPGGEASDQAGIMGRGLEVFANICLNGRRP